MVLPVNNYQKQKINKRTREDRKAPPPNAKQNIKLTKLKQTQKVRGGSLNLFGTERPFKVNRPKNVFFQITSAVGVDRSFQSYQEVPWMFLQVSDILRE